MEFPDFLRRFRPELENTETFGIATAEGPTDGKDGPADGQRAPDPAGQIPDPFSKRPRLPKGVAFVIEDLDREYGYVAWRVGCLDVRGFGTTQLEAVLDLERTEGGADG
jgi:hypothetical protein